MGIYKSQDDYIAQMYKMFESELRVANLPERGVITQVLLPSSEQHNRKNLQYSRTAPVDQIKVDSNGILGDRHYNSHTREVGRNKELLPGGAYFEGYRHMLAISPHDCEILSDRLGKTITPELLGVNLVIAREDRQPYQLSALPPEAYLVIAPENAETQPRDPIAILVRHALQKGCKITGACISQEYGDKTLTARFKEQSTTNRGIVCRVMYPTPDQPAKLRLGQKVFFLYSDGVSD